MDKAIKIRNSEYSNPWIWGRGFAHPEHAEQKMDMMTLATK